MPGHFLHSLISHLYLRFQNPERNQTNLKRTTNAKYFRMEACPKLWRHFGLCTFFRYRPSELYNVVADVASYPSFVPFCTGARILSKTTPTTPRLGGPTSPQVLARVMEAELTVGFLSFRESYVSKVTCRPNELVEVSYHFLTNANAQYSIQSSRHRQ